MNNSFDASLDYKTALERSHSFITPRGEEDEVDYLDTDWHTNAYYSNIPIADTIATTWRPKQRTRTSGMALVLCLNIGTDPPDIVKPSPCARVECWKNTWGQNRSKASEEIGHALEKQYEKWQSKAKSKLCCDATSDELRRASHGLRKSRVIKNDRVLFHYNGHGVPRPTGKCSVGVV